jgi:hypothetical protein
LINTAQEHRHETSTQAGTVGAPIRSKTLRGPPRAARLATLTYADVLQTRVVFGTPTRVTERLSTLRHEVGLSGIIMEPNIGGRIPHELLLHSMRLFTQEVAPSLR